MARPTLVVHGHFYQPPRENPWTEMVAAEPSAAPAHDWNERITAECYRPNGWARIVDERDRVVAIVDNYAHLSFNVGPTLLSWLADHAPEVVERMREGDRLGGGAIAQAYNHIILALASERDVRTQVRWGLADFRHRFGRDTDGLWLPETAVNDDVLRVLAEEGVGFTILAPNQALRVRPLPDTGGSLLAGDEPWHDVGDGSIDTTRPYRWVHPDDPALGVDLVFYDGALSHEVAFAIGSLGAEGLVARAQREGLTCVAADGETFGHHHTFAERTLAYGLPVAAPRAGMHVTTAAGFVRDHRPTWQVEVRESAWSCAHGVGRWREDCGCSTGGPPGANQAWRAPLRAALDLVRDVGVEVFERRGAKVLHDPWEARDAYVDVVLGARTIDDFAGQHVKGDLVEALTLLEQQRHALLMFTSCAWFFWDLAGLETVQCLRYAARAMDLLAEVGESPPVDEVLDLLATAVSNQPGEGDGRRVWRRHVEVARVDSARVAAHLALGDLLEGTRPEGRVACWEVVDAERRHVRRGAVSLCAGSVRLVHARTRRVTDHAYAAVHLGGLEVLGAVRAADPARDTRAANDVLDALERGERVTTLLRLLGERYGSDEFGLERALPDAAEQIVAGSAAALEARFADAYARLYAGNQGELASLTSAGYPLPTSLRLPAEMAVARRLEAEVLAEVGQWDARAYEAAVQTLDEADAHGLRIDDARVREALALAIADTVDRAIDGEEDAVDAVIALLVLADRLEVRPDVSRPQEKVYDALRTGRDDLEVLGYAVGLAVGSLGVPR